MIHTTTAEATLGDTGPRQSPNGTNQKRRIGDRVSSIALRSNATGRGSDYPMTRVQAYGPPSRHTHCIPRSAKQVSERASLSYLNLSDDPQCGPQRRGRLRRPLLRIARCRTHRNGARPRSR